MNRLGWVFPRIYQGHFAKAGITLLVWILCTMGIGVQVGGSLDAEALLVFAQGGGCLSLETMPVFLVLGVFPWLLFLYLFSDWLSSEAGSAAVYVFTRSGRRRRWFWCRITVLAALVTAFFFALETLLVFLLKGVFGAGANAGMGLGTGAFDDGGFPPAGFAPTLATLNALLMIVEVVAVSLASLRFGELRSFLAVSLVHVLGAFAVELVPAMWRTVLCRLVPSAQGLMAWHDLSAFRGELALGVMDGLSIPGFDLAYSYAYLACVLVIELVVGALLIQQMDFI